MKRRNGSYAKRPPYKRRRGPPAPRITPLLSAPKGPEKKWIDTVINADTCPAATYAMFGANSAADTPTLLNGLAQGTGSSQRIGRRVTMRSILLRMNFYPAATSTRAGRFRVIVVYDKQTNGSNLNVTDLMSTDLGYSALNLANSERFVVLYDKYTTIIGPATLGNPGAGTAPAIATMKLYRKLKLEVGYSNIATGGITTVLTGGLFLVVYQIGMSDANPGYDAFIRIRYTDD